MNVLSPFVRSQLRGIGDEICRLDNNDCIVQSVHCVELQLPLHALVLNMRLHNKCTKNIRANIFN